MSDGARHFDAKQARNAEQKPKEARHEAPPNKYLHVPLGSATQFQDLSGFPVK